MNDLVFLACKRSPECGNCGSDCDSFWAVKEKLQKFGKDVSRGLAGKGVVITELRNEEWYKKAVNKLHWNGYVLENKAFKKIEEQLIDGLLKIEEQLINGLPGLWAQK